jgi:hypothetical protein
VLAVPKYAHTAAPSPLGYYNARSEEYTVGFGEFFEEYDAAYCAWQVSPRTTPRRAERTTRETRRRFHPLHMRSGTYDGRVRWSWPEGNAPTRDLGGRVLELAYEQSEGLEPLRRRIQPLSKPTAGVVRKDTEKRFWLRSSASGRYLYVHGYFHGTDFARTFEVYDLHRRRWTGLGNLQVQQASSSDFAAVTAWETLVLDPTESRLVASTCTISRCRLRVVDIASQKALQTLDLAGAPGTVVWSPDGERVAVTDPVTVWEVGSGAKLGESKQPTVSGIAWLDEQRLVGVSDGAVRLWAVGRDLSEAPALAELPAGFRAQGITRVGGVAGPFVAVVGEWDNAAVARFYRARDGAVLTLRADCGAAVWFADDGRYEDTDGAELAGVLSSAARSSELQPTLATEKTPGLWRRFWSGELPKRHVAVRGAPRQPLDAARKTPSSLETAPCNPEKDLCRVEGWTCPPGHELREGEPKTCTAVTAAR